jgi:hypothetical protein
MITYDELSPELQRKAVRYQLDKICHWIGEGYSVANDETEERITAALMRASDAKTPWFFIEYMRGDEILWKELNETALEQAKEALYISGDSLIVNIQKLHDMEEED